MTSLVEICGEIHPADEAISCAKSPHPFGAHMSRDGAFWDGLPLPQRSRKGAVRVMEVVQDMRAVGAGAKTGPPQVGPPAQAQAAWTRSRESWVAEAKCALKTVCEQHETFTNEQVWALVDDTREKRAMVLVTRHGLRLGWMSEDSAVRVNGVWRTRDGVEFPLNKLVPVYRSALFND